MNNLIYIYFIIVNIIGFYFMYIDKRKAIKNEWRISEDILISIAIIGGSLGSLLGMYTFRHKTKHLKFTIGIPFIILFQIGVFII